MRVEDWVRQLPCLQRREERGYGGREQPAMRAGQPGRAASSTSGCLHRLILPVDKVKGSPESTLPIIPPFSLTAVYGTLEADSGVKPAQDIEQSESVIST